MLHRIDRAEVEGLRAASVYARKTARSQPPDQMLLVLPRYRLLRRARFQAPSKDSHHAVEGQLPALTHDELRCTSGI
jgi:hypothetical protein